MVTRGLDEELPEFKGSIISTWDYYTRKRRHIDPSTIKTKNFEIDRIAGGWIYLLKYNDGGPDYYKIGSTCNPRARMESWEATLPDPSCIELLKVCYIHTWLSQAETQIILACSDFLLNGEWLREDIGPHRTFIKNLTAQHAQ